LFQGLLLLIGYTSVGYPLLIGMLGRLQARPIPSAACEPTLSIVIPAYNEERVLARKLASVLSQDYPSERMEIIVASDGSTDATDAIVESFAASGVRLARFERMGKTPMIDRAIRLAVNDIVVLTDANAILAPGSLRAIAVNFADSSVGGVSADERREPSSDGSSTPVGFGEQLYWNYDKSLKRSESRIGSMVSASGSLWAIRRSIVQPITDPSVHDDFALSTQVIRAGYRLVFEPDAVTWEPPVTRGDAELQRKVRIISGGLRSVYQARDLLLPWNSGVYALQLWSHKVLRRMTGFGAIALFALTLSLSVARRPIYRCWLAAQVGFYTLAALGWVGERRAWGKRPWLAAPYYICLSLIASMIGFVNFLRGRIDLHWQRASDVEAGESGQ